MPSKIRKQIYIEPHQDTLLKAIAQQARMSEAEIIRQALARHRCILQTKGLITEKIETAIISCAGMPLGKLINSSTG